MNRYDPREKSTRAALSFAPPAKRKLADHVYSSILQQLSERTYKVGDKLPSEEDLSLAFSVSRPVLRDALAQLQEDGFVSKLRGSGSFVRQLPPVEMSDRSPNESIALFLRAYEVRRVLEAEACRLAARRAGPEAVERLADRLHRLRRAIFEEANSTEADFLFHLEIARASGNDMFVRHLEIMEDEVTGSMRIATDITSRRSLERRQMVYQEHLNIFSAIAAARPEEAETYCNYHIAQVRLRLTDSTQ